MKKERLPHELVNFFETHQGASLLIRGDPGSGKTILSLTLLKVFASQNGFYISTRVEPKKIHQWFPWTEEFLESSRIIDATGSPLSTFEDSRFIEQIDKMSLIKSIYSMVREGAKFIVIDSFSSLELFTDSESLATSLTDISRRMDVKLILVSEEVKPSKLDYLVDGIVTLTKSYMGGRIYREISLEKLRNVEIRQPKYPFTLFEGKFSVLKPSLPLKSPLKFEPIIEGEAIKSGDSSIDEILKLLSFGDFVLLELSDNTSMRDIFPFIGAAIHVFLNNEKPVIIVPPEGIESKTISELYESLCGEKIEKHSTNLRIFEQANPEIDQDKPYIFIGMGIEDDLRELLEVYSEFKKKNGKVLLLVGFDLLEYLYGEREVRRLLPLLNSRVKSSKDLLIAIGRDNLKVEDALRNMADVHVRILKTHGGLFFDVLRPKDGLWHFGVDDSGTRIIRVI